MKQFEFGKLVIAMAGVTALISGAAQAGEQFVPGTTKDTQKSTPYVKSRGADAAYADLMRDWSYRGIDEGVAVGLRSDSGLIAELGRGSQGSAQPASQQSRRTLASRSHDAAYNDLMRNWGS